MFEGGLFKNLIVFSLVFNPVSFLEKLIFGNSCHALLILKKENDIYSGTSWPLYFIHHSRLWINSLIFLPFELISLWTNTASHRSQPQLTKHVSKGKFSGWITPSSDLPVSLLFWVPGISMIFSFPTSVRREVFTGLQSNRENVTN